MSGRDFLPPLVLMAEYQNDWNQYLAALYEYFCHDFVATKPIFGDKPFALKRHPMIKGKEATFWHLISEGEIESERTPDFRRCERIRWPYAIIMAAHTENIKCWKNTRKNETRVLLALEDFSYVVVLADRGEYILLWTAYCVEQEHRRNKLRREYEEYRNPKS